MRVNHMTECVKNYLDISTTHVLLKDCELLEKGLINNNILIYDLHEFGYWVFVHPDIGSDSKKYFESLKEVGFSYHFYNILKIAYKLNCTWVRLDRDGIIYKRLPEFNW